MSFLSALRRLKNAFRPDSVHSAGERGIILFTHTGDVIQAESVLKQAGLPISVKAPPPDLRTGCDLGIEYLLLHESFARVILDKANLTPLNYFHVSGELLEPISIFQHKDFGEYLMVRAANMKLTVEKSSGRIVNVSGGGCPDVPYLGALLVGTTLQEGVMPRAEGRTLCAYALQLAWEEAKRLCVG
ncbi:MAG: DUF3343 domain-containing protein [Desulfovibrio sp.]|jgi:hypothetical protein|nr:DUF3343 domain-containing protein [Desulfovibrio sp.]